MRILFTHCIQFSIKHEISIISNINISKIISNLSGEHKSKPSRVYFGHLLLEVPADKALFDILFTIFIL